MIKTFYSIFIIISGVAASAQLPDFLQAPFKWQAEENKGQIIVQANIPEKCYLYADKTKITVTGADGQEAKLLNSPEKVEHNDEFTGKAMIYPKQVLTWRWQVTPQGYPYAVRIKTTGCRENTKENPGVCFPPQKLLLMVKKAETQITTPAQGSPEKKPDRLPEQLAQALKNFTIIDNQSGYMKPNDFVAFLKNDKKSDDPDKSLAAHGIIIMLLLVLLGGLGLNLTPCVLPMIPINLAIIGAGDQADNKWRGFSRGGAYGLGIALAYGALGLIAVLTGARFGSLNSSPYFNIVIGLIFLALGLAMFDIFNIDFSRFSSGKPGKTSGKAPVVTAFIMGIVAALLAGACVAPVVIAVLIYAASLYSSGNIFGLLLPFVLGIGMALPWPFAGAGMAVIPKPGQWMVRIKQVFGVVIIAAALYFGWAGVRLFMNQAAAQNIASASGEDIRLAAALDKAHKNKRKVLIDFQASWCGNCKEMEKSVFPDPKVRETLADFEVFKFAAEDFDDPRTSAVLDFFKVPGLPTFVILKPNDN